MPPTSQDAPKPEPEPRREQPQKPSLGDAADAERDEAMHEPTREAERRIDEGTGGQTVDEPKIVSR